MPEDSNEHSGGEDPNSHVGGAARSAMAAKRSLARVAGLDVDLLSRLESNNFRTCEDVLTRHPFDLVELLDVNLPVAEKIVTCVARACCPKPVTAKQLLDSRTDDPHGDDDGSSGGGGGSSASSTRKTPAFVRAHLAPLDDALGGGVPTGSISELVGPAGAGKTQMCLTLACACAAPKRCGGLESGVVFIDTEQRFSSQRLAEIARAKFPETLSPAHAPDAASAERELESLTSRILVLTPSTLSEMLQRLNGLEEALIDRGVRLLIVDSVAALARAQFGRGQLTQRQELLGQIASALKQLAERLGMAAFVTNQVTTRVGARVRHAHADAAGGDDATGDAPGSVTAALGTKWAHCVNTRLVLEGSIDGVEGEGGRGGGGGRRRRRRGHGWRRRGRAFRRQGHQGCEISEMPPRRLRVRGLRGRVAGARGPEGAGGSERGGRAGRDPRYLPGCGLVRVGARAAADPGGEPVGARGSPRMRVRVTTRGLKHATTLE